MSMEHSGGVWEARGAPRDRMATGAPLYEERGRAIRCRIEALRSPKLALAKFRTDGWIEHLRAPVLGVIGHDT